MRAMVLLISAILLGLAGGYGWSKSAEPLSGPTPASTKMSEPEVTAEEVERSVYYQDCNAAVAAGNAPILAGRPGYRRELDPDGDGVGCVPLIVG